MTKVELLANLIEVKEKKEVEVKNQRYEAAAKLRDEERRLYVVFGELFGLEINIHSNLNAFLRDAKISEILKG